MVIFGIETTEATEVEIFVEETNKRLHSENFFKNPFQGKTMKLPSKDGKKSFLFIIEPAYPKFFLMGFGLILLTLMLQGWKFTFTWWYTPSILIASTGIMYSRLFFVWMLKIGLKKAGYINKINILSKEDIIKRIAMFG